MLVWLGLILGGYVSPYSETLMIDVPRDGSAWLLLLPLLMVL